MSKNKSKATHNNETNKLCPFCGEPMYLREIKQHKKGNDFVFRLLCHNCKFIGLKHINPKYRVSEVDDKCIIEYIE